MQNGSFLIYKRRRTRKKKTSRAERTKCCRTDFGRFSLCSPSPFRSIVFLCRFSRRLALFRGTPECVRQHLRPAPLFVRRSEQASASVRRLVRLYLICAHRGVVKKTVQQWNRSSKAREPALHTHARQEVPKDELGTCEDRSGWIW